jgi:hypothetical protein
MKKFTFVLMLMLAYAGFTVAQTIENFESIKMNMLLNDPVTDLSSITVVPNPDTVGNLTAIKTGRFGAASGHLLRLI